MGICGIICEYNPVHLGHIRHISETRRMTGDGVVCVMSGNFVQRGAPAVYPKHIRAEAALSAGADLVLQMNVNVSLSSAEGFAMGGVSLLDGLGVCDHISFGSESGDIGTLSAAADALLDDGVNGLIPRLMADGTPYAAAREEAVRRLGYDCVGVLENPNDNLGVEYIKAIKRLGSAIVPVTVRRETGGHSGALSSTAIRDSIRAGEPKWSLMSEECANIFRNAEPVFLNDAAVLSRLRMMKREDYGLLPDASEGLGDRLYRFAVSEPSVSAVTEKTKTKRYAYSRISRMVMCAAIGITREDMTPKPYYIRVLASNERGREILRQIGRKTELPVITKPSDGLKLTGTARRIFELDAAATDLYSLFGSVPAPGGEEYRKSPVMK